MVAMPFHNAPSPIPLNIFDAEVPPTSPALMISAHAVPSGKRRFSCSFTIRYRRRGIISKTPRAPPVNAIKSVNDVLRGKPRKINAGMVNTTAAATDSPADPTVCTILFSRTVFPLIFFRMVIAMTAMGIDAEVVSPTLSPR